MRRPLRRLAIAAPIVAVVTYAGIEGAAYVARHPQDFPWTDLDLDQRAGRFTGPKLAALGDDPRRCRALLTKSGSRDRAAPPRVAPPPCGYVDGMMLVRQSPRALEYRPAGLVTACPVVAALTIWERDIVQRAAQRHFGRDVTAITHAGSYSCRRIAGQSAYSEHSTADAIDIMEFQLVGGRTIIVSRDWTKDGVGAAFLRDVRDGACGLFSTISGSMGRRPSSARRAVSPVAVKISKV